MEKGRGSYEGGFSVRGCSDCFNSKVISQVKKQPAFKPTHVSARFPFFVRFTIFVDSYQSDLFRCHKKTFISFTVLAFKSVWCDNQNIAKVFYLCTVKVSKDNSYQLMKFAPCVFQNQSQYSMSKMALQRCGRRICNIMERVQQSHDVEK